MYNLPKDIRAEGTKRITNLPTIHNRIDPTVQLLITKELGQFMLIQNR